MFNSDISLEIHYGQSNRLVATELFKFPKEGLAEIVVALRKTEKTGVRSLGWEDSLE